MKMMNITMSYCIRQIIVRFFYGIRIKENVLLQKEYFDLIWSSYAIIITEILEIDRVVLPKKSVCWTALFQQKKTPCFISDIFGYTYGN